MQQENKRCFERDFRARVPMLLALPKDLSVSDHPGFTVQP